MTLKVIHWLKAFSNRIRRTFVQHFTWFQLTVCSHGSSALAELIVGIGVTAQTFTPKPLVSPLDKIESQYIVQMCYKPMQTQKGRTANSEDKEARAEHRQAISLVSVEILNKFETTKVVSTAWFEMSAAALRTDGNDWRQVCERCVACRPRRQSGSSDHANQTTFSRACLDDEPALSLSASAQYSSTSLDWPGCMRRAYRHPRQLVAQIHQNMRIIVYRQTVQSIQIQMSNLTRCEQLITVWRHSQWNSITTHCTESADTYHFWHLSLIIHYCGKYYLFYITENWIKTIYSCTSSVQIL